jgi:hypothetical protein
MSTLDADFEILCDDWDRLVALESIGVGRDYPAVCAIRQRWCLEDDDDSLVVGESSAMMERAQVVHDEARHGSLPDVYSRKVIKGAARGVSKASKGAAKLAGRGAVAAGKPIGNLTAALAGRFRDFSTELGKEMSAKFKEAVSKATLLEKQVNKLQDKLKVQSELDKHPVYTGGWTSKVCLEDKVNVHACIALASEIGLYEDEVQKYTVKTRGVLKSKKLDESGDLRRLPKSTNWAVKRASGLLGIVNGYKEVTASPFPGNVIVVEHKSGKISWAVARDGDYGETIDQLSKSECGEALSAVHSIITALRLRGVKRKAVGYSGVYDEVEQMQAHLKDIEGAELKEATRRFKNALALEDALTTALVRCAEGLLEYVKQSIAVKEKGL